VKNNVLIFWKDKCQLICRFVRLDVTSRE